MENIRCMDGLTFWANVIMTEYRTLIVIVAIICLFVKYACRIPCLRVGFINPV